MSDRRSLRTRRRWTTLLAAAFPILLPASIRAADPQPYRVQVGKTGDAALDAALHDSSTLISLRKSAPVGGFALVARAKVDQGRFATALQSFGYYKGQAHITIAGHPLDDPQLADFLDRAPKSPPVKIDVTIDEGPLFHLRHVAVNGDVPADVRAKLGVKPGDPAIASNVLAGQSAMLTQLQNDGYALAKVATPAAVEFAAQDVLDVSYKVDTGPRVDIGRITFSGLKDVNPSYVQRRLLLHPGELYNGEKVETARQDLAGTGLFSQVRIKHPDHATADGTLPLTLDFTEGPKHTVSFDAVYSTDLGGALTASWTDVNLFGNGEQLKLSAAATELGGTVAKQPGYNVGAQYLIPDWLRRDQTLQFNVNALKEYLETYNRTAYVAAGTVSRRLSPFLTANIGLSGEQERIAQEGTVGHFTIAQVPLGLTYDDTGSLFEPIHGYRAALVATPSQSFGGAGGDNTFLILKAQGSTYINLSGTPGRTVLALRGLLASIEGTGTFGLPPDQRLYAGGSDTIRGYKYQFVGPHFPDGIPTGGTSLDAATIELRQRIGASFGAAVFVDAGQVGLNPAPFSGSLRIGAGVGARYYTSIGPIRVDVAVPLIKQPNNDALEVYVGIGEAF